MPPETAPEQRKENYGMFVKGICNGFRRYTRKKTGEIVTQLLVNLPGASSSLQVEIPNESDMTKFKDFEPVSVKIIPSFYEGRIIGFSLA
ncbi:MAG: hypothetical protein PHI97_24320 [Desulfobulbus sp.]|nr:hypothetical protein [Desulfobulbus sp.]